MFRVSEHRDWGGGLCHTEELRAAEEEAPLEDFPDWQHDAIRIAKDIVETDHYLPLPDRFEIN